MDFLRKSEPGASTITDVDALCVRLAGLCHDIGHGPFSHTYDGRFVRLVRKSTDADFESIRGWAHEHASADMIDHLIEENELWEDFKSYGIGPEEVHFVKELIFGSPADAPRDGHGADGDPRGSFFFEIVANHRNGIDVDKFDYFARDCLHLGMVHSFDSMRLMRFSRILKAPGALETQIAYHEKEAWNIYELFHTRYNLHKRAYQHRVARAIEAMLCDALVMADPHIRIAGKDGREVMMSRAMHDMKAFTTLTDSVFRRIEHEGVRRDELTAARALLHRVHRRQLYAHVGETLMPTGRHGESKEAINESILNFVDDDDLRGQLRRVVFTDKVVINYGMGNMNPVDHVLFFLRSDDSEGRHLDRSQVSCFIPQIFEEVYVRLYCKDRDPRLVCGAQGI